MKNWTAMDLFKIRWHQTQLFVGPVKGIKWMVKLYVQDYKDMFASYKHIMTH